MVTLSRYATLSTPDCLPLTPAQPSPVTFQVVSDDLEAIRDVVLESPVIADEWQQRLDFISPTSEWAGWEKELRFLPALRHDEFFSNPILVPDEEELHGYLLVHSGWYQPHPVRIIFLLDYQQVPVLIGDQWMDYYDMPALDSQGEGAIEFILPGLEEGFHQLSTIMIADPESDSTDWEYRLMQRTSFREFRSDIWIGFDSLPPGTPGFESFDIGVSATKNFNNIEFIGTEEDPKHGLTHSLEMSPGEEHCINLQIVHTDAELRLPYTGPVYFRIGIFWDDVMVEYLDYELPPDANDQHNVWLMVKAPNDSGSHQLHATVFTFPGYSKYLAPMEPSWLDIGLFTWRVLVEVQP